MVPSTEHANYVGETNETITSAMSDRDGDLAGPTHRVSMTKLEIQRGGSAVDQDAVRFKLRKRTVNDERQGVVLSSYNSDFLSGIFADIAQATSSSSEEPRLDPAVSVKKSRVSLTRSFSRCSKSYANLSSQAKPGPATACLAATTHGRESKTQLTRDSSLTYQMHCVSSASSNESEDFAKLAFPHLPATVSDSSCGSSLTRNNSGQQLPAEINANSYGWFIEMEDEGDVPQRSVEAYKATTGRLAFQAPTAPKAVNHDAEVEWAKAADTVDDVLGVFF